MSDEILTPTDPRFKDIKGYVFGRLTVISYSGRHNKWVCLCSCGSEKTIQSGCLVSGNTRSCGCLRRELAAKQMTTHGMSRRPEYFIWRGMLARCENAKRSSFADYGGRGISVCARWKKSFENFFKDMGSRPTEGHSIDRINNSGNYEPSNCKWSTREEQGRNKRNNRLITFRGKTQCVQEWVNELGISRDVIIARIDRYGWSVEKALSTPLSVIMLEFNGKSQSIDEWSKETGISYHTLHYRINNLGWPVEKALSLRPRVVREIFFDGKTKSIPEWSREVGVPVGTLRDRLGKLNWSIERALTTPVKARSK